MRTDCFRVSRLSLMQHGLTLIELVVFIVIIGVGLAGILQVINITTRASADPIVNKQAIALAEAILEEVLTKSYAPNATYTAPAGACPDRIAADDVEDYANCNGTAFIAGNATLGAASIGTLAGYQARVTVTTGVSLGPAAATVTVKRITVTVTDPQGGTHSLTGYKADY